VKRILIAVVVAIVAALISIVIHVIIENCIGGNIEDNVSSISPMVKVATKQILWSMCNPKDPDRFVLKHVFYNDSLVLGGSPVYLL